MSPRMRLLKEVYDQLRADDPDTNITMYALRTIIKSGKVATIQLGRKTLINYDSLLDYLYNGDTQDDESVSSYGGIRRVS